MMPLGQSLPPTPETPPARRSRWRIVALGLAAALAVLALMTLSISPWVAQSRVPDTDSVTAARSLLKSVSDAEVLPGERLKLRIEQNDLDGLAQLSNQALAPLRVEARLVAGTATDQDKGKTKSQDRADHLLVRVSRSLPLGLWVNIAATARASTSQRGLPAITVKIGRLPIPQWLTHLVLNRLWRTVQGDSLKPLELDKAITRMTIARSHIWLVIVHPGRGASFAGLARANGSALDAALVARTYCAIANQTDTDLSALVRRTWALPAAADNAPEERNRALLAALAMRAVPEYRDRLAGAALPLIARCPAPALALTLGGREDLAKHWTLSAALAATLGGQVARSMGAWKELADSAKGGSGFSFVDLAADRSGERFAMAAVDPTLASAVSTRLRAVTQGQMLPSELLARPEGLDQAAFERDYSTIDSSEYKQAVRAIDAVLNNAGVPSL